MSEQQPAAPEQTEEQAASPVAQGNETWKKYGALAFMGVIGVCLAMQIFGGNAATSAVRQPPAAVEPLLQLQRGHRCSTEVGYRYYTGQVLNISERSLRNVTAVSSYYTRDGTFVKSDEALIEFNPILPGQKSPFRTITTDNPAIAICQVDFKELLGGTILHENQP